MLLFICKAFWLNITNQKKRAEYLKAWIQNLALKMLMTQFVSLYEFSQVQIQ